MTPFEQVATILSDAHKDAYGFRPSAAYFERYKAMSPAEFNAEWNSLIDAMEEAEAARVDAETFAAREFEARVARQCAALNVDRATFIRWDMEAHAVDGDVDYYKYLNGLSYQYDLRA